MTVDRQAQIVWLDGPGDLAFRDEALSAPQADELMCKTIVTAISPGTELAAWRGLPPLRPSVEFPRLQGYCNVARVLDVGTAIKDFAPGDRVLSLSSHRSAMTLKPPDVFYRLAPRDDADAVATAYLFHLGYNACLRSGVCAGSRVMVIGLGVLGLTSVAMASLAGAEVIAMSGQSKPADIARKYGASGVFGRDDDSAIAETFGREGADVVILTTNGWSDFKVALKTAAQNATIACLGFPGRGEEPTDFNPLDGQYFYMKQLRIEAVGWSPLDNDARGFLRYNMRDNLAFLARSIASGKLDPGPVVSGKYPASEIKQAYRDLDARKDGALTYLLDWS